MRSKHSSFVVTLSAFAACTPTRPTPTNEPVTTTPTAETSAELEPPIEPETPADAEATVNAPPDAASPEPAPTLATYPNAVNPRDANGRTIHKAWDGNGCFVELPFPPGQMRPPGSAPPTQKVACPATMSDPAYDSCKGGVVYTDGQRSGCICFIMGNPPPVPKRMTCPK